jgi:hypothetical protein
VIRRYIVHGGALAQLQRPNVGGNGPAVRDRQLRRVVLHRPEPVRHHIEEIADRCVAQAIVVIRGRLAESALHDHAVALAGAAVARRTEHVEALLPALHDVHGHRHREGLGRLPVDDAPRKGDGLRAADPRATVLTTSGRADWPSAKNALRSSGS